MSPARVRYELDGARRTPASSRQDAADPFESDDVLSSSKKDDFNSARGNKNGTLPFKALPTPAKSSQIQVKDESGLSTQISRILALVSLWEVGILDSLLTTESRQPRS